MTDPLTTLGRETHGIVSVCSAHPLVIEATLEEALARSQPALIEATCNQVNHRGGYTGMTPADFIRAARQIAVKVGFPQERLIFGGDHLGPNPWRHLPAEEAMAEARLMMAAFVEAGFRKIHLDCSMGCAGEPVALGDAVTAARAADLCKVAEARAEGLVYVIGTEVPVPGGAHEVLTELPSTAPEAALETWRIHRDTFARAGLAAAFSRAIALVVQPGVEFGQTSLVLYDRARASTLISARAEMPGLVYEAHSTDYQPASSLAALVADGFAILKVGPGLTFALREALYGMDAILAEVENGPRRLRETMEVLMLADPGHWQGHVHGSGAGAEHQRHFGLSDRVRYYWPQPEALAAVADLESRFRAAKPDIGLISQYLGGPLVEEALGAGIALDDPPALVKLAVRRSLRPWLAACA